MKKIILVLFATCMAFPAFAENIFISAVPTGWRLQDYLQGGVVLWFTTSKCGNGQLALPTTATTEQRNRLWSSILSAKQLQKSVYVYYDYDAAKCTITSFGTDQ